MEMTLLFRGIPIGTLKDVFLSDEVWYGSFEPLIVCASGIPQRVNEYIQFCQDWNEKCRTGAANLQSFAEFGDVIADGGWLAKSNEFGQALRIENAPNFFTGGDVSFRESK